MRGFHGPNRGHKTDQAGGQGQGQEMILKEVETKKMETRRKVGGMNNIVGAYVFANF